MERTLWRWLSHWDVCAGYPNSWRPSTPRAPQGAPASVKELLEGESTLQLWHRAGSVLSRLVELDWAESQLVDDFGRYVYLPRLVDSQVLLDGIADGLSLLTWERESFGYADSYDEALGRYRGLRAGQRITVDGSTGLLVKLDVTGRQMAAEAPKAAAGTTSSSASVLSPGMAADSVAAAASVPAPAAPRPKRFHGSVTLDPTRVGRDAGRVADEVISHLVGLVGSLVTATLEIHAEVAEGVPEKIVKTVTENCRTLKFQDQGFEES